MSDFDKKAENAIPAEVRMISGSHDAQTSADVFDVGQFSLPDPAGRAGGACTSAILEVLYANKTETMSWVDVLRRMRTLLNERDFEQIPQLTSSRMIEVTDPMHIVKPGSTGVRRAVLIGINYVGQQGQLSGCHNDVNNIKEYLLKEQGFEPSNMIVLMDDGVHQEPTRQNILAAYQWLVTNSHSGDTVFCHYSGHGGRLPDDDGDEDDGYDETLIPVDFQSAGQIRDDDLFKILVHPMAAGVTVTCLMDCCHSGTVLDLPYRFVADGDNVRMEPDNSVDFSGLLGGLLLYGAVAGAVGGGVPVGAIADGPDEDCCSCLCELVSSLFGGDDD